MFLLDINECADGSRCKNGLCINNIGSYQCQCREGYMLLESRAECIDMREEPCYMKYEEGECTMPMRQDLTRFKCCCSMGAAWGSRCEACPRENSRKEIHHFCIFNGQPGIMYALSL